MTTDDETERATVEGAVEAQRRVLAAAQRETLKRALEALETAKVRVSNGGNKAQIRECLMTIGLDLEALLATLPEEPERTRSGELKHWRSALR